MKQKPSKATYRQADAIHSLTSPEISIPLHFPSDSSMSMGFWRLKWLHLTGQSIDGMERKTCLRSVNGRIYGRPDERINPSDAGRIRRNCRKVFRIHKPVGEHEATFHSQSYGFRTGRSAHDAQKRLFLNLRSQSNGKDKRVIELDIEKCFDRINHAAIMDNLIAPAGLKLGIFRCLKAGTSKSRKTASFAVAPPWKTTKHSVRK
jgi:Reverse transcriptase (RNA-dependent DNA polymerase)